MRNSEDENGSSSNEETSEAKSQTWESSDDQSNGNKKVKNVFKKCRKSQKTDKMNDDDDQLTESQYIGKLKSELREYENILKEKKELYAKELANKKEYYTNIIQENENNFKRQLSELAEKFCEEVNYLNHVQDAGAIKIRRVVESKVNNILKEELLNIFNQYKLNLETKVNHLHELDKIYKDRQTEVITLKSQIKQKEVEVGLKAKLEAVKDAQETEYFNQEIENMNHSIKEVMEEWTFEVEKMKSVYRKLCSLIEDLHIRYQKTRILILKYHAEVEKNFKAIGIETDCNKDLENTILALPEHSIENKTDLNCDLDLDK